MRFPQSFTAAFKNRRSTRDLSNVPLTKSKKFIIVFLVIVGMTVLGPLDMTGRAYSVFPGTNTNCTDFRLGQLTDTIQAIQTLGIVDLLNLFDVDLTDEGWVWKDANEPFKSVSGVAMRSHMAVTDLTANHNSHDQIADILVDAEYLDLVSDVNADHSDDDDIGGEKIADSIEMEWESGIDPHTREEGIEGPNPYFPKWAWPSIGDRVWTEGHWVFDCGHGKEIDGEEHYRTEIHPARAIASMRDQLFTLPGTGTTPVRGIATDLYIHGQSGYMVAQLNCGMNIVFADDPDGCAGNSTPIDDDFTFNITLRTKPFPSAILATFVEDGPGNTVNIAPDLEPLPADDPTKVKVTIPLDESGATPDDIYSRKIYAAWIAPPADLKHHSLTLDSMDLDDDKDDDPGDCECTFFFLNTDRSNEDEWIRLSDFTTVDPFDDFDEDDMNDYDDNFGPGNGEMGFTGATFDYYISDNMPVEIRANGYDQDCLDDWFGDHKFDVARYGACYNPGAASVVTNWGNSDGFIRANAKLVAQDYGCLPGSSDLPTESGKEYTLCTSSNGRIHLNIGRMITLPDIGIVPSDEYDLFFSLDEIALTNEDTADLDLTKSCEPGMGQSFDCTIIVDNLGPGLPRNVVVQDTLSTDAGASSFTLSTPTFTIENSYTTGPFSCTVTPPEQFACELRTIPVDGKAMISFTVTASQPGIFDDTATVTTDSTDPNMDNNEGQFRVIVVDIDIKPGDSKNTLSINNNKSVRVAILGTATFDVTAVDLSPLATDAPKFGGSTPRVPVKSSLEDVNKDGNLDLVLMYNSGPKNPLGFNSGDTQGCITGALTDGTPILGCDPLRIIK